MIPKPETPVVKTLSLDSLPTSFCNEQTTCRILHQPGVTQEIINKLKPQLASVVDDFGDQCPINPLESAIMRGDTASIEQLMRTIKNDNNFKLRDSTSIEQIETGSNSKYAYGVATRKVALGRGNREGNNALGGLDSNCFKNREWLDEITCDRSDGALESSAIRFMSVLTKYADLELFKKIVTYFDIEFRHFFDFAVRNANIPLAAFIAKTLINDDGYGLNDLHHKCLIATNPDQLGVVRSASVKKKNMSQNYLIMPIFCAAINPHLDVFMKVWNQLEDKFIKDEKGSSVIFYAALNENPAILKFLLDNNVEFRETNKLKETPLMWAARTSRHQNIELLIKKSFEIHNS